MKTKNEERDRSMMKFSIQSRNDDLSNELMEKAKTYLVDFGLVYDEENPEIVLSIGGDGTMLHAFHKYKHLSSYCCICRYSYRALRFLCRLETIRN